MNHHWRVGSETGPIQGHDDDNVYVHTLPDIDIVQALSFVNLTNSLA